MTHFKDGGPKTAAPETLGPLARFRVLLFGVRLPRPINSKTPAHFEMSFQPVMLRECAPALELWRIDCQNPKGTILLFPGYATPKDSLLPAAKIFNELGYNTLLLDFRAIGGSSGTSTTIGCLESHDVRRAVHYASASQLKAPTILYAGSMGAAAVLRAIWLKEIAPDALILECPFDRLSTTVKHRFDAMRVPTFPLADLLLLWGGIQTGFNAFAHNPCTYAKAVRCPVLMMHGQEDPRVTLDEVKSVYDAISSRKEWHLFAGLGHELYVAASPNEWKDVVGRFLKTLEQPT